MKSTLFRAGDAPAPSAPAASEPPGAEAAPAPAEAGAAGRPSVCFLSAMCLVDPVSGAAHSIRTILETLAAEGHRAHSFTASLFDSNAEVSFAAMLGEKAAEPEAKGQMVLLRQGGVDHYVFRTESSLGRKMTKDEQQRMVRLWAQFLASENRPDIVLSFGASALARRMRQMAREAGCRVVFYLGNAETEGEGIFEPGDRAVCCSAYLARHYAERFGIETAVLNPVIEPGRFLAEEGGVADHPPLRRFGFVTFINPIPHKGLTLFARLAQRAHRERPEMRFLVLEGRMPRERLQELKLDLAVWPNVWFLPEQRRMSAVYARTAVLLVPSFWREGFGRSVIEAHLSGIPVLASDRGGLTEALGGVPALPVPEACCENHFRYPDDASVGLWWDALAALWDDDAAYRAASARAREAAEPYRPERTRAAVIEYFARLAADAGPAAATGGGA